MKGRLEGKIALITGAAQGIGEETAIALAREGGMVVVSDIDDEKGKLVAEKIGKFATYLHLNVRSEKDWSHAIGTIIQKFSKLDILVNNAGITGFQEGFGLQDPENASLESWKEIHAVNSNGVFLGCKYAIRVMKKNPGSSIINISSRSGLVGIPGAAAYASLASDESKYITGIEFTIDGGLLAGAGAPPTKVD